MIKSVLIVSDSYGKFRLGPPHSQVEDTQTWPSILSEKYIEKLKIEVDCQNGRRLVDLPKLITENDNIELLILHLGIVDIYPRPLPPWFEFSNNLFLKIIRRLLGKFRRQFAIAFGAPAWSSDEEIVDTLYRIEGVAQKIWLIIPSYVIERHNYNIPGANNSIDKLAAIYFKKEKQSAGLFNVVDMRNVISNAVEDGCLSPRDSHYTVEGNRILAEALSKRLDLLMAQK